MPKQTNLPENFTEMTLLQRANHLIESGVYSKTDIENLDVVCVPYSCGVKLGPAGAHDSPEKAVEAGMNWLQSVKKKEEQCQHSI